MDTSAFSVSEMASSAQAANSSSTCCAPWSPSQLAAGFLQDPLTFEFHWPDDNQFQWPEDKLAQWPEEKKPQWSDAMLKAEDMGNVFTGSGQAYDQDTVEQFKREFAQIKQDLDSLRQEMESVRLWMDEVVTWSENINKVLASQGSSQESPQSWATCLEPGCICQWEEEVGLMEEPSESQ
ncbi:hypothetical protein NpNSSI1_00002544 [Neofusicoccum parvum]|nr:hypothetical protein NpNSSI1_00002544 [Neofusicoccum parvum]